MPVHQFRPKDSLEDIDEPPRLGDRAIDNLRFIRETMERSTSFTAVPGYGGALMGATAIGAAIIAANQTTTKFWLITWLAEATLAFAIGFLAMWQKARLMQNSLISAPARKFAFGFAPALFAGVVLTILLYRTGQTEILPVVWLLMYGAAVTTGGMFSVKPVPLMGVCFLILGALAAMLPINYGDWFMAAGFGVLQIIFGFVIARKHGG
ncbi:MAG TPA: hypothetical protein VEX64_11705 [Pyrinomonadaceae bacterium]|jgi:hypothetical protein|nr:hypothetical protein [Pyrinomonadaceae bacterium]